MTSIKTFSIGISLITGVVGIAGAVAYSKDLFNSNIQISELLRKNNKHDLLDVYGMNNSKDWDEVWEKYMEETGNKWNIPSEEGMLAVNAPTAFKEICRKKAQEKIKSTSDQKYQDVIKYCSKPKQPK
ncbi:hypothetical protein A6V39_03460 [Candidatus Mycoplasma haematobovis]|uniref:Uncharacterized protein n=1 Tax=Candidatus Mycoplasma haematobovis TaxID=432608 RepID=A0A1A9QBW0_9MOLU|nr:hypothetical protein [Candidatus Mycoplasma haematobovis]OAL09943.1 hypothetical protein A6V39_03460 [Candidatus Mycoplasma haematobovis]